MILVFDAETNGLPKNYQAKMSDIDNWPRVIQLAWATFDLNGELFSEDVDLVQPDGWVIPDETFWIDNGFTQLLSEKNGNPIMGILGSFIEDVEKAKVIVAHNINFDYNVLGAELLRAKLSSVNKPEKYCTMKESADLCKLPGKYGSYKWPKLIELHQHLFDEGFEGAHDALIDVKACAKCYFELIRLKVIESKDHESN